MKVSKTLNRHLRQQSRRVNDSSKQRVIHCSNAEADNSPNTQYQGFNLWYIV